MVAVRRGRGLTGGVAVVAWAAACAAQPAVADEIQLRIDAGRVTLVAAEARVTDVLAAWSAVGQTRFVDAEAVAGEVVTLQLVDVSEAEALRLLLRGATGHVAAARPPGRPGASRYDRVKILGTGRWSPDAAPRPRRTGPDAGPEPAAETMPIEDLQRLLDAVSGTAGGASPSPAPGGGTVRPAPTTPFPGMVAEPGGF